MADRRLVWDLPLRAFHWLLALSIVGSYATAKAGFEWMQYHFWIGYGIIGLLLFRIVWGFIGPRHARFVNFVPAPGRLLAYLGTLFSRDSKAHVGHNPAGAVMVLVILLMVSLQAFTGLFATDDIAWSGPYNPAVSASTAGKLTSIHHKNFDVFIWVIVLHVAAIVFYRLYKKQNLLPAMLHGRKPADIVPPHEAISSSQLLKALIVALVCAGAVYALVQKAPPPPDISYN